MPSFISKLVIVIYLPKKKKKNAVYIPNELWFGLQELEDVELPWWLSGKESTCLLRVHVFNSLSRKIPTAEEQLNPGATITEACML